MGSSKRQTVGYWYHPTFMLGLHQGPFDAFLRFRAGDVDAWQGELTASGTISINKPDLWGGVDAEGGILGDVDVLFGEATQMPSAYYSSVFGDDGSAHRGVGRLIFKGDGNLTSGLARSGRFGAMNPYPKPVALLTRRILKGWDNDECWYPEKAAIALNGGAPPLWLISVLDDLPLKTSPDGRDWSATSQSVTLEEGGGWGPTGGVDMVEHEGRMLAVSTAGGSGSHPSAYRDEAGTWHQITTGSIPAGQGRVVRSATHWFICRGISVAVRVSADPISVPFTDIGVACSDGCVIGDRILFAAATGASFGLIVFRHTASDGTDVVDPGDINVDYLASNITLCSDGVTGLMTVKETVGTDWRVRLHSSDSLGAGWTDHGSPFPFVSTSFNNRRVNALYDPMLGRWFVASHNRIAIGTSPGAMELDEIIFPSEISGIDSDGEKVLVCGDGGMLYAWTPFVGWQALDSGTTDSMLAIVAMGTITPGTLLGMNAAHVIYDSLVAEAMQAEPVALINDASFRSAADTLYAEAFGICADYDPDAETCEDFRQRICNLIGAQCSRSTVDGKWYLDLARGDYSLDSLPVLTDDDIIEFGYAPSTLDDSVNQVSVRWFDPLTKQERTTAPVHALGAIHATGGIVPEIVSYPDIPYEPLADRCAARDLQAKATPTKRFTLTTNRVPYSWRRGSYFRLQAPKRGIADMVCLVGEIAKGTLKSGAIRLVAMQDVYSMPATSYVVGQPPVDGGTTSPTAVEHQVAFETPYTELAAAMSTADLAALDSDSGFVQVVGVRPAAGSNYQLRTRLSGGEFDVAGTFDWCPSATVVEAADDVLATAFTLADGSDLEAVAVGSAALWGGEVVRVDALDRVTGAVSFGRGCADTVPATSHSAGERIYFFDTWSGTDETEYVTGETVEAKLLTRTGTAILDEGAAALASVTLDQRAARPYAPARIRINGEAQPAGLAGELAAEWAWRDRVLQADQLVDNEAASIGPEAGATATLRWFLDGALVQTHTGVAGTSQSYTPASSGLVRVEIEAVRDGLVSWQMQVREFDYTTASFLTTEPGVHITLENGSPISLE